jgi:uncharacterized protein (TIGR00255 family)
MKSMTGYGRGECAQDGFKITVEVSAVNRRQADINIDLPRDLVSLEAPMRDLIHASVSRGRVMARVALHAPTGRSSARMHLNLPLAKAYAQELRRMSRELKLSGDVMLDHLVRAPGVFQTDEQLVQAEDLRPAAEKALKKALAAMLKMRAREGAHLARDLGGRIRAMRKSVSRISRQAPKVAESYRQKLVERIRNAGVDVDLDDERLLKEVALFADRSDISEELARLGSHFEQFDELCASDEPVGRTLDFLAQELNREINTIGSKANNALISREVVTVKAELEKFREQAQNVE